MDEHHNKYHGHRAATRFNAKKTGIKDRARVTKEASGQTDNHTDRVTAQIRNNHNWPILIILAATAVFILIGLIVFIGGNIWELYPLLHQIEFPVFLNTAIVVVSTGLVLGTLILQPRMQLPTAIITGTLILALIVIWHFSATNDTGQQTFYIAHPARQKHPTEQKTKQLTKPRIVPHMRRRLCLDDGTDLDRIECQKQSGKKRNYTWATL